jgi:predicted nucleotidyltransferase
MHVIYYLETLLQVEYVNTLMAIIVPHFMCKALKIHYLQLRKPKQKEIYEHPACYNLNNTFYKVMRSAGIAQSV